MPKHAAREFSRRILPRRPFHPWICACRDRRTVQTRRHWGLCDCGLPGPWVVLVPPQSQGSCRVPFENVATVPFCPQGEAGKSGQPLSVLYSCSMLLSSPCLSPQCPLLKLHLHAEGTGKEAQHPPQAAASAMITAVSSRRVGHRGMKQDVVCLE